MKLHREERDNYVVAITVEPSLTGTWQASFDDGETWIDGTPSSGNWAWLVAGPDFADDPDGLDPDDTVATITVSPTIPLLRVKDDPVLDVEKGPAIRLWGTPAEEA